MEARQFEDEVEIEGGAPASSDVGAASGADKAVSEGSQASGESGFLRMRKRPRQRRCRALVATVLDPRTGADHRSSAAAFGLKPRKSRRRPRSFARKVQSPGALAARRSNRSTVLISFSQGVSRSQALAGNTVNAGLPAIGPAVSVLADPLGLRPATPSSSRRRSWAGYP